MDRGVVDLQELRRNIELAAAMLDSVYTDETRWANWCRLVPTGTDCCQLALTGTDSARLVQTCAD